MYIKVNALNFIILWKQSNALNHIFLRSYVSTDNLVDELKALLDCLGFDYDTTEEHQQSYSGMDIDDVQDKCGPVNVQL